MNYADRLKEVLPVSPPTEPITLTQAKAHLRVTASADDTYITDLITASRCACEKFTGATLVPRSYQLALDCWPGRGDIWWDGVREGSMDVLTGGYGGVIKLPQPPLVAVSEIGVYDDADVKTVFSATQYYVDAEDQTSYGRIVLRRGSVWPPALRVANAIVILFTAGYGQVSGPTVPPEFTQALKLMLQFLYRNRGDAANAEMMVGPCGASSLLANCVIKDRR
jgi:hypothetical protein